MALCILRFFLNRLNRHKFTQNSLCSSPPAQRPERAHSPPPFPFDSCLLPLPYLSQGPMDASDFEHVKCAHEESICTVFSCL